MLENLLIRPDLEIPYRLFPAGSSSGSAPRASLLGARRREHPPLVSAIMVSKGHVLFVERSIRLFERQTWPYRELIVATDAASAALERLVEESPASVRLVHLPSGLTLGEYRNLAIARAEGEYICQWDDDDWYDARRIEPQLRVLLASGVDAVFLERWLIWWQRRSLLFISQSRIWEGSILSRRSSVPVCCALKRGEDSAAVDDLMAHSEIALVDLPALYCYSVTGANTYGDSHFEGFLRRASQVLTAQEYEKAFDCLDCFSLAGLF